MKSLADFATLQDAKIYTEKAKQMLTPDIVVSVLTANDSVLSLEEKALTDDKAAGFLLALRGSVSGFNLMAGTTIGDKQQQLLNYLVLINAVNQDCANELIYIANDVESKPFENATLLQFNQANKIYTEKKIESYRIGQRIVINLSESLPDRCAITAWAKEDGFDYENLGQPIHVQSSDISYKIAIKKGFDGDLYLRLPYEIGFTCELA